MVVGLARGAWLRQLSSRCLCQASCRFGSPEPTRNWQIRLAAVRLRYTNGRMAKVGPYGLSDIGEFNITWNRLAPIRWIGGIRKSTAVTSSPYLTIAFLSLTEATIFSAPENNFECNSPATQAQSVRN